MANIISFLIWQATVYSYGLFNFFLYLGLVSRSGKFFSKPTEQEQNEFLLARDKYWNLSRTVFDLHHRFLVLRNGLKLHYLTNIATLDPSAPQSKHLVIFLHGFPDTCLAWRYVTESPSLRQNATLVAVDLPGFGGSDSLPRYGATEVMESLTEFIVAMRETYLGVDDNDSGQEESQANKVLIVGHDWGCILSYRLAAEAPSLADRFILTNGPHAQLALSNKDRILTASKKMMMTFLHAPLANYHCFPKVLEEMKPLAYQVLLFGYISAFQLPKLMVKYLGSGGNYFFIRGALKAEYGKDKTGFNPPHSLAMTMGPGQVECRTTADHGKPERYGESVFGRAKEPEEWFISSTAYYRDGAAFDKWEKSIHTVAALHNIAVDNEASMKNRHSRKRRQSSASSTLFSDICASSLKAPATIIWGKRDQACTQPICLNGIGDYLARDSQVLMLPNTGHWTPIETASRESLKRILEKYVQNGDLQKEDLQEAVRMTYPNAFVSIDK